MSCHCCPCDHSSTIRQYFSNINLWSNSKVTQLDRQSDSSACYHSYGEGAVIKEQCMLCGAVHGAETFSFSNLSKMFTTFYLFSSFFFKLFLLCSFIKNHLLPLNSHSIRLSLSAPISADQYTWPVFSADSCEGPNACSLLIMPHTTTSPFRAEAFLSPSLIEWEKLSISFAAEIRHRPGYSSYRPRADMPAG